MEPAWAVVVYMVFLQHRKRGAKHRTIIKMKKLAAKARYRIVSTASAAISILYKLIIVNYEIMVDAANLQQSRYYNNKEGDNWKPFRT